MKEKNRLTVLVCAVVFIVSTGITANSQSSSPTRSVPNSSPSDPPQQTSPSIATAELSNAPPPPAAKSDNFLSDPETKLTLTVAVLGLVAMLLEYFLLRRIRHLQAEEALRVFGVTLILIGTLLFVTAAFSAQQIAPALGLFGTVAGYLLGRVTGKGEQKEDETKQS